MTVSQINAELFRELSIIAEDEGLMKKALKAIKKLSAQKRRWMRQSILCLHQLWWRSSNRAMKILKMVKEEL